MATTYLSAPLIALLAVLPWQPEAQVPAAPQDAVRAVGVAAALSAALLEDTPFDSALLSSEGCYVWGQPGVALVPETLWTAGTERPGSLYGAQAAKLLAHLPYADWREPIFQPTEQDGLAGLPAPGVYLLDAHAATARLARLADGYHTWLAINNGELPYPALTDASLSAEFAVVYLDAAGSFELYFQRDAAGSLVLTHIVERAFFSA
jgi:hypothetical protein